MCIKHITHISKNELINMFRGDGVLKRFVVFFTLKGVPYNKETYCSSAKLFICLNMQIKLHYRKYSFISESHQLRISNKVSTLEF